MINESAPRTEEELKALLRSLPSRLQKAVRFWCRGQDPQSFLSGISRSAYYRDRKILASQGINLDKPHPSPFAPHLIPEPTCYCIQVKFAYDVPFHVFALNEQHELFLSPLGRLSGFDKRAELNSHSLALALADHCLPRLRKRYGEDVELEIREWKTTQISKGDKDKRVREDSKKADAYLGRNDKWQSKI